jgi:hypothetical protein
VQTIRARGLDSFGCYYKGIPGKLDGDKFLLIEYRWAGLGRLGGRLERILSSLAREWLRITNGLLIVEDPEPAPRSPNKLMRVNGAERRKVVRALSGSKRRTEILVR